MEAFSVKVGNWVQKGNCWKAEPATSNLVFMTGMQEHSERYDHLARYLNDFGISVYVLDAVGQGLNAPRPEDQQKWFKGAFDTNVSAAHQKVMELKEETKLPTFIMGHSMGSFMTQRYLELFPDSADKVVIWSSNGPRRMKMACAYILASILTNKRNWDKPSKFISNASFGPYARTVKNRKTDVDWLSYDEENRKAYAAHPYCGFPPTGGFWKELLRGVRLIWTKKELKRVAKDEQIFIIAGEEDPVGQFGKGPTWLCAAYQKLGVRNVTVKLYPHMRHEITNETERGTVFVDIRDFVLGK